MGSSTCVLRLCLTTVAVVCGVLVWLNGGATATGSMSLIHHGPRLGDSAMQQEGTLAPIPAQSVNAVDPSLVDLIRRLPKAELHIHIEGTMEPEMMWRLAERNNVTLPYASLDEAKAARAHYDNLDSFLDTYRIGLTALKTEQDFHELAAAYLESAAANNITHAEIFFDVQNHIARGVEMSAIIAGLQAAIDERASHPTAPVHAQLILCIVRELGGAAAAATVALALPYLPLIHGLGLASTETYPPELFIPAFKAAELLGLYRTVHAGEESGPEYVWGALKMLDAQRIDHGIHSLEDPKLVEYMSLHQVPITLCPISNTKLQVYGKQLPDKLREVLTSGIPVTINSDDPAYFGPAYLNANYEFIAGIGGLGPVELARLARNSFSASFIPEAAKQAAYQKVEEVLQQWTREQQQQQQQRQQQAVIVS